MHGLTKKLYYLLFKLCKQQQDTKFFSQKSSCSWSFFSLTVYDIFIITLLHIVAQRIALTAISKCKNRKNILIWMFLLQQPKIFNFSAVARKKNKKQHGPIRKKITRPHFLNGFWMNLFVRRFYLFLPAFVSLTKRARLYRL